MDEVRANRSNQRGLTPLISRPAILDLENFNNPDPFRWFAIDAWKSLTEIDIDTTIDVERLGSEFHTIGLKPMDSLHIASAIEADADAFLTTEEGILRKMKNDSRISVFDPIDFLRQQEDFYENRHRTQK